MHHGGLSDSVYVRDAPPDRPTPIPDPLLVTLRAIKRREERSPTRAHPLVLSPPPRFPSTHSRMSTRAARAHTFTPWLPFANMRLATQLVRTLSLEGEICDRPPPPPHPSRHSPGPPHSRPAPPFVRAMPPHGRPRPLFCVHRPSRHPRPPRLGKSSSRSNLTSRRRPRR